jgi:L-Lysine epsilon oxidase N-terminal/L-lysine epsilon oxidase C-terminal domain
VTHEPPNAPEPASAEQASPDCGQDPIGSLAEMFTSGMSGTRPVFRHTHGIARGVFRVLPGLPGELAVGVFAGSSYPACIRFSSDTSPAHPDPLGTCGIAIKLFGVPGKKLLPPEGATTHDFLLENHDVFFVDTAQEMCEFTYAGAVKGDYPGYLRDHPKTKRVLDDMKKPVDSVLTSTYWSGLPSHFGKTRYVKYKLVPAGAPPAPAGEPAPQPGEKTRLHDDLRQRLLGSAARFHLYVQFQTDPGAMPVDAATVRWDETASPPVHVATLTLESQDIEARGQPEYGENLAFNSWHALPEHAPAGSIADARRVAYERSATIRREHNHVPLPEPHDPPAPGASARDTQIVRAAIHPAVGIARVGNSRDEYVLGPEIERPPAAAPDSLKDATGALKRQAARFRVYGYNAAGEPVAELTSESAEIEWTVHVANTKAAWYEFQLALDIPEAKFPDVRPSARRNAGVTGAARDELAIDPGPRTIAGPNVSGSDHQFDSGEFLGTPVYLGELRTDEAGRLIFLGGRGVSASSDGSRLRDFANNDNWHDDVSDGPVTARVVLDGKQLEVEPAWVVTAPPNYAPELKTVRTMHDLLYDVFVEAGWLPSPESVSFAEHVYPLFERLTGLQWVNHAFATKFGWGGREHLLDPAYLSRLASRRDEHKELREQIWTAFRDWKRDGKSPNPWPWIYGDSMNIPAVSERQHLAISPTQRRLLERWADGDFTNDPERPPPGPSSVEELPLAEQPAMLDRAALAFCLADAFHPGCEMTWPVRHLSMYASPYRIRHRPADETEPDYGDVLTPERAVGVDGPLHAQGPGSISRWMAVPWQGDTASCLSGYGLGAGFGRYDPYLPTFWPARVPNDVLRNAEYQQVMKTSLPIEERRAAFESRASWLRWFGTRPSDHMNDMVSEFGKFGIVESRPGPGDGEFPDTILVESEVGFEGDPPPKRNTHLLHVPEARDAAVREDAVADALEQAAVPADAEVSAGYFSNVDRFPPSGGS